MIQPPRTGNGNPAAVHCEGKQAFASHTLAASVSGRQTRREDSRLVPYHCTTCRQWHLCNPKRGYLQETPNRRKTNGKAHMRGHREEEA